jgi:SnoaL-like domain
MTGVFVREDGEWKVAQSHASIGVPNADIFG